MRLAAYFPEPLRLVLAFTVGGVLAAALSYAMAQPKHGWTCARADGVVLCIDVAKVVAGPTT